MHPSYRSHQTRIGYVWRPALLYGSAYSVFALATKLSSPLAGSAPTVFVSAFALGALPGLAWAVHAGLQRRKHRVGPAVRLLTSNLVSGLATFAIVGTTVLAYLFDGVSILLALVLMRLGVLAMAPMLDLFSGRRIRPAAWVALGICIAAALTGILSGTFQPMSAASLSVLCLYLLAYGVRLWLMTRHAKTRNRASRGDWFLVEMSVAMAGLAVVSLVALALSVERSSPIDLHLTGGALLAGLAYGQALVHGTLIYLDWRENAYSIAVNRSASLIAGLVASLAGSILFAMAWPPAGEWVLAMMTALALFVLGDETSRQRQQSASNSSR